MPLLGKQQQHRKLPHHIIGLFAFSLFAQVATQQWLIDSSQSQTKDFPPATDIRILKVIALGEKSTLSRLLMLWIQAFNNQPGVYLSFRELDYDRLTQWLDLCLQLDPKSRYPLMAATHLYASQPDPVRQKKMMKFIRQKFLQNPNRHWRWMVEIALIARHKMHNTTLALLFAKELSQKATGPDVPEWIHKLYPWLLADLGEHQQSLQFIQKLVQEGHITDKQELLFLQQKMTELNTLTQQLP
ncbi:MAG: hypothetical protein HOM11_05175 [Methylococcales bacterium]|jgi:hypothetical protein|nr:hypothetical protein [Methylococcales bacterium]